MQHDYMTFGVDQRGTAIVMTLLRQWPHLDFPNPRYSLDPSGDPCHFHLDMLACKGRNHVCRAFGNNTLGALAIFHRAAMQPHVFGPTTPARLVDADSKVKQPVPELGVLLPIHVAFGLSDDALSLEFAEHDDKHCALPGTVRTTPLGELAARGPDAAATAVGNDMLSTLVRLYPAVFAPFPGLTLKA